MQTGAEIKRYLSSVWLRQVQPLHTMFKWSYLWDSYIWIVTYELMKFCRHVVLYESYMLNKFGGWRSCDLLGWSYSVIIKNPECIQVQPHPQILLWRKTLLYLSWGAWKFCASLHRNQGKCCIFYLMPPPYLLRIFRHPRKNTIKFFFIKMFGGVAALVCIPDF